MKKLLVVMLVLGLASMANAQMYLTINAEDNPTGTIEALVGDVLTIDIYGDGGTDPSQFFMDAGGEGQTDTWDISQATIDYTGSSTALSINDDVDWLYKPFIWFMLDDVPSGTTPKAPLGPTPKPLIDTILLTVGLADTYAEALTVIQLRNGDTDPVFSSYSVHVTPEPITVALLGLGGLMLRRRK